MNIENIKKVKMKHAKNDMYKKTHKHIKTHSKQYTNIN